MSHQIEEIGTIIKNRRKKLKYNQADFELISEIGAKTQRALEKGNGGIALSKFLKILDVLGLEMQISIKQSGKNEAGKSVL